MDGDVICLASGSWKREGEYEYIHTYIYLLETRKIQARIMAVREKKRGGEREWGICEYIHAMKRQAG